MMPDNLTVWIGLAGFVMGLGVNLFLFGWKAKGVESKLREDMNASIAAITKTMRDEHDEAARETAEATSSLSKKFAEVELWNRDNFVRREDFFQVVSGIKASIDSLGNRFEAAFARLDAKFDKIKE